jgi:hypothetical protein
MHVFTDELQQASPMYILERKAYPEISALNMADAQYVWTRHSDGDLSRVCIHV